MNKQDLMPAPRPLQLYVEIRAAVLSRPGAHGHGAAEGQRARHHLLRSAEEDRGNAHRSRPASREFAAVRLIARSLLLALCLALLAPPGEAAVPQTINYQGLLTSNGGVTVDATVALTFRLYEAESGGTSVWSETKPAVEVSNGAFSVVLGSTVPIDLSFAVPYWITVAVNGDAEMSPRQPLASSPYAFRSAIADAVAPVNCPAGMTKVAQPRSTLCFASGPVQNWDAADQYCYDTFRSNICTVAQWRVAVCRAGLVNPGASWTSMPAGAATFTTVSGCTGDAIDTSSYTTQRATTCCLEWMNY